MSENWNWRKSLRNEEMRSAYSELFIEFMKELDPLGEEHWKEFVKDPLNLELERLEDILDGKELRKLEKTIMLKYRPTGFEAKWIYWFHIEPNDTKQIKIFEGKTFGVKKTNSTSLENSVTASVGFPIDIVSITYPSKTTLDAIERNVTSSYNKAATDTHENKSGSTKAYYHLHGIITYADGMKSNYNTGYQEVSTYGVECKRTLPKQDARDSWDSLMEE